MKLLSMIELGNVEARGRPFLKALLKGEMIFVQSFSLMNVTCDLYSIFGIITMLNMYSVCLSVKFLILRWMVEARDEISDLNCCFTKVFEQFKLNYTPNNLIESESLYGLMLIESVSKFIV